MLRNLLYGKRPEYCVVVDYKGNILQRTEGSVAAVTFNWHETFNLFNANRVFYILHSHPYGMSTLYSYSDRQVFESWAVATGQPIYHRITNFKWVTTYAVNVHGNIEISNNRQISLTESLTNWPWGVRL